MEFRFDKLTIKAQEAVQRAQELAADRGNPQIDPLHLLAALLGEQDGVVQPLLEKIGATVRSWIASSKPSSVTLPRSPAAPRRSPASRLSRCSKPPRAKPTR